MQAGNSRDYYTGEETETWKVEPIRFRGPKKTVEEPVGAQVFPNPDLSPHPGGSREPARELAP